MNASRCFSDGQPVGTHVALANDTLGRTVNGNIVRTHEHAVLTTDALIVQMRDDSRDWVLFISIDGASMHASRLKTVVTRRRHVLNDRLRFGSANQQADVSPKLTILEPVQIVARRDARFTTAASV